MDEESESRQHLVVTPLSLGNEDETTNKCQRQVSQQ